MKCIHQVLSVIMAVVIFTQGTAWATGAYTIENKARLEMFVKHFNSLSSERKLKYVNKMLETRPMVDQNFIKENLGDLSKVRFPELNWVKDSVTLTWQKQDVIFTPIKGAQFKINDIEIDFSSGKFAEAGAQIEKIFSKKNVTVMDLVLSSAYAGNGGMTIIGIVLLIVGLATFGLGLAGIYAASALMGSGLIAMISGALSPAENSKKPKSDSNDLGEAINSLCEDANKEFDSLQGDASTDEISDFKESIRDSRNNLMGSLTCMNGNSNQFKICNQVKACLDNLENKIDRNFNAINNGSRIRMKNIERPVDTKYLQKDASDQ